MIFVVPLSPQPHDSLVIHDQSIERVSEYKYLGTTVDNKINWNRNTQIVADTASQRLYFLRKQKEFHVDNRILVLFHQSFIQSILTFNFLCTFGNLSQQNQRKLDRPRKIAQRLIYSDLPPISTVYEKCMLLKVHTIMNDSSHPLHNFFGFNRSGIRLRVPRSNRCRYRQSFVPNVIHMFNANVKR